MATRRRHHAPKPKKPAIKKAPKSKVPKKPVAHKVHQKKVTLHEAHWRNTNLKF